MKYESSKQALLKQADQCVMCGLCLPHCATYLERRNENESPRGRISLIQGYLRQQLLNTASLQLHLEQCLLCRSCESMCPSEVPFGELMEQTRLLVRHEQGSSAGLPKLQQLLTEPVHIPGRLLRLYQRSGLQWLARTSGLGHLLAGDKVELLPALPVQAPLRKQYPAHGERLGKVALFTGCLSQVIERQFLQNSILLLQAAGFDVHIPPRQVCCGAMHYHAGDTGQSDRLLQQNREAFTAQNWDAVIFLASGCGLFLQEHLAESVDSLPVTDIYRFLAEHGRQLEFAALDARALLHLPCSLRQFDGAEQAMQSLLGKIPGLQTQPLAQNNICCGGAGNALLQQPQLAGALRHRKAAIIKQQGPVDYLLTANTGCYIQFSRAMREHRFSVRVCYPVQLLAQQLAHTDNITTAAGAG